MLTRAVFALATTACLCAPSGAQPAGPGTPLSDAAAKAAGKAATWLDARFDDDGRVRSEYPDDNIRYGGRTALAAYALLAAGYDPGRDTRVEPAVRKLKQFPRRGVYAVAMRICALAEADRDDQRDLLAADTRWLIQAVNKRGAYTYTPAEPGAETPYDNSNTQLAVLAVYLASQAGVEVPKAWWALVEDHWKSDQQIDGGWAYWIPPGRMQARSYGSMTAAGLASLLLCDDVLHRDDFVRCSRSRRSEPISQGLAWLGENFSADHNPGKGAEWYYYWLFCLQRAAASAGQKRLGTFDWRRASLEHLLRKQNDDGSFGYGDRVSHTAFALMALSRGRSGVLVNKLRYTGKWNARPRDAAHLARWVRRQFEVPCRWQATDIAANPGDLYDAPIAYISGAGAAAFTDEQIEALRRYVLAGGLIVSEAACNNGDFTLDMQRTYQRMFPGRTLARTDAGHPIYSLRRKLDDPPGAWMIDSGVRPWAIHMPREISLALQSGKTDLYGPTYELLTNLFLMTTEFGRIRPIAPLPEAPAVDADAPRIRLALIKHKGNWDPEPGAMTRLAAHLAGRLGTGLTLSEPMGPQELDAAQWPVARLTGTEALDLTEPELAGLKRYIAAGGTLLADAAGASQAFHRSLLALLPKLPDTTPVQLPSSHEIYTQGPTRIQRVAYRGTDPGDAGRTTPRLAAARTGDRLSIFYSHDDLTAGLADVRSATISGYAPASAMALYVNLLFHAAGLAE